jgi:hypothetical protein
MKTKIAAAVAALTLGLTALATTQAQAFHPHGGWGHGGFRFGAGTIIGAAIANDGYYGCHWEPQYNRKGQFIRSIRVCD